MVTEFVIQNISEKNFAKERNPKAHLWSDVSECLVNADFDPCRLAFPRVVITTVDPGFVDLAFARSYFTNSVPARKAALVEQNYAIKSDQIFLGDGLQKRSRYARGVKGRLVVLIGFDDTGLGIGHRKSLTAKRNFGSAAPLGKEHRIPTTENGSLYLFSGRNAVTLAGAAWGIRQTRRPNQNTHAR